MHSAAELARIVNQEIRALAERLPGEDDADRPLSFLCEDGCGRNVALTLAAYLAAEGAWLDGHHPA